MKKSILAICMLTLVLWLLSCDINALNEMLRSKTREKLLDAKTKKVENLNSRKENQEWQRKNVNVFVRIKEEGIGEINKKNYLQEEKEEDIVLSQINVLTKEQEDELSAQETKANDIKIKVNAKLLGINAVHNELNKSLSELESMQDNISKANYDLNKARSSDGKNIDPQVKINLDQKINKIKDSSSVALTLHRDTINTLAHAISSAEHAKSLTDSALSEAKRLRLGDYYTIYSMICYISDANESLSHADSMFKQVEADLSKLMNNMKQAKEDFGALKDAHQELKFDQK